MPKQSSIAQLLQSISPGETVFVAGSAGEPTELTRALVEDSALARGAHFITSFVPGINTNNLASAQGRRMSVFFMQTSYRNDWESGSIQFRPLSYSAADQFLRSNDVQIDGVVLNVSEPDEAGLCSLGPSVEFMPGLLARSSKRLAVVNPKIARLPHSVTVPMDSFSAYARSNAPLVKYDAGAINEISRTIGNHLAELIPNEATVQIGLGKIPCQLFQSLTGHRGLGIHTGMLSDSILPLMRSGALRRDRMLTTTVMVGSEQLYGATGLEAVQFRGVDYTHNPDVLAAIPAFHAINSAMEVDLLGQVNAETLSGQYVSGPGGLPDFAHAARRCPDGLSVIALPATDSSGNSRIVCRLAKGTPVVVPGNDVDVVVTEYGVARLRGVDLDERARRLIAVAHPDHRGRLTSENARALRGN